ncbi:MAG: DNA-3-methyladenine glycosylase I [Dehalococcoidia bacterium]
MDITRCQWAVSDLMIAYHDNEWGVPVHDDRRLFELLILEGAQAGLSWEIILKRRDGYRRAFDNFDIDAVAGYDQEKAAALLLDDGIIKNRLKIAAAIGNAKAVQAVQREFGSLDGYLWGFVDGKTTGGELQTLADVPVTTPESDRMSSDLKKRGFRFVGPTICYSLMQSAGMVNDHVAGCFRREEVRGVT